MSDVLLAGGRIAGAALVIMLGRAALTVELFEQEHFPRANDGNQPVQTA